jgi:NADH-quinone oxidoreductase subunit A
MDSRPVSASCTRHRSRAPEGPERATPHRLAAQPERAVPSARTRGSRFSVQIYGENWIVVMFMVTVAFVMGMLLLTLNQIVAPSKPSKVKSEPYESGMPGITPVKPRFTPRFYVIAMLFVVFDIEAVFIYPWAVIFDDVGLFGFVAMVIFMLLLLDGYIYAWKKGALEWV